MLAPKNYVNQPGSGDVWTAPKESAVLNNAVLSALGRKERKKAREEKKLEDAEKSLASALSAIKPPWEKHKAGYLNRKNQLLDMIKRKKREQGYVNLYTDPELMSAFQEINDFVAYSNQSKKAYDDLKDKFDPAKHDANWFAKSMADLTINSGEDPYQFMDALENVDKKGGFFTGVTDPGKALMNAQAKFRANDINMIDPSSNAYDIRTRTKQNFEMSLPIAQGVVAEGDFSGSISKYFMSGGDESYLPDLSASGLDKYVDGMPTEINKDFIVQYVNQELQAGEKSPQEIEQDVRQLYAFIIAENNVRDYESKRETKQFDWRKTKQEEDVLNLTPNQRTIQTAIYKEDGSVDKAGIMAGADTYLFQGDGLKVSFGAVQDVTGAKRSSKDARLNGISVVNKANPSIDDVYVHITDNEGGGVQLDKKLDEAGLDEGAKNVMKRMLNANLDEADFDGYIESQFWAPQQKQKAKLVYDAVKEDVKASRTNIIPYKQISGKMKGADKQRFEQLLVEQYGIDPSGKPNRPPMPGED